MYPTHPSVPATVEDIADAVTHARFVGTDHSSDGVVLMKILQVLRTLMLSPEGAMLTDESVCEIMLSCFRICFETRLTELLRRNAEQCLRDMTQLIFMRLPQFPPEHEAAAFATAGLSLKKRDKGKRRGTHSTNSLERKSSITEPASPAPVDPDVDAEAKKAESLRHSQDKNLINEAEITIEPVEQIKSPAKKHARHSSMDLATTGNTSISQLLEKCVSADGEGQSEEAREEKGEEESDPEGAAASKPEEVTEKLEEYVNHRGIRFTPHDESHDLQPYGLVCVRELFRFLISLCNPLDPQNTSGMVHLGLALAGTALEVGADHVADYPSLLYLVKDPLCRNLLSVSTVPCPVQPPAPLYTPIQTNVKLTSMGVYTKNLNATMNANSPFTAIHRLPATLAMSSVHLVGGLPTLRLPLLNTERISIFALDLQITFLLFEALRFHLKFQMEAFFKKIIEIISTDISKANYELKEIQHLSLESLAQIFRIPGLCNELYLNYDCDVYCMNVFEEMTKLLSKNVVSSTAYNIHSLSLEALMTIIEAIEMSNPKESETEVQSVVEEKERGRCGHVSLELGGMDDVSSVSDHVTHDISQYFGCGRTGRHKIESDVPSEAELDNIRNMKKWVTQGTELFNQKPERGIEYLQEHGVLKTPLDPEEVAMFLRENPDLDKKMIGEYICKRSPRDEEDGYAVLAAFAGSFDYAGLRIDQALRLYLETFRLPGEAPLIFLVMERFAERWHTTNGSPFANTDAAFRLAYAVIMLNMDQHNHNAKKLNVPMTAEDFVRNLRGCNGSGDFDQPMLEAIFHSIKNEEMVMPAERVGPVRDAYLWRVLQRRGNTAAGRYRRGHTHRLLPVAAPPQVSRRVLQRRGDTAAGRYRRGHTHRLLPVAAPPQVSRRVLQRRGDTAAGRYRRGHTHRLLPVAAPPQVSRRVLQRRGDTAAGRYRRGHTHRLLPVAAPPQVSRRVLQRRGDTAAGRYRRGHTHRLLPVAAPPQVSRRVLQRRGDTAAGRYRRGHTHRLLPVAAPPQVSRRVLQRRGDTAAAATGAATRTGCCPSPRRRRSTRAAETRRHRRRRYRRGHTHRLLPVAAPPQVSRRVLQRRGDTAAGRYRRGHTHRLLPVAAPPQVSRRVLQRRGDTAAGRYRRGHTHRLLPVAAPPQVSRRVLQRRGDTAAGRYRRGHTHRLLPVAAPPQVSSIDGRLQQSRRHNTSHVVIRRKQITALSAAFERSAPPSAEDIASSNLRNAALLALAGLERCAALLARVAPAPAAPALTVDTLLLSLCKFTGLLPPQPQPLHYIAIGVTLGQSTKAQLALRRACSVAARHADCVRDAWRHLLEIVHTLYAGRLLPKVLPAAAKVLSCAVSVAARHADCVRDAWRHLLEIVHTLYAGRLLPKVLSCAVSVAARHADCVRDAWRHLLEIVHTLYAGRLLPKVLSCAVSVAARHADCVRDAWRHLLEIVHTLYAGRLLPKVLSCAVSVAARHADCVRDAWRHLLEIVHTLYAGRLLPKVLSCAVSVAARHADCVRDAWRHLLEIVHTLYAGRLLPKVLSCAVSVAARHADCVRDAWRHLLEIVHTLYAGRLLPKVLSCAVSVAARHADCVRDAWRHLLEIVHTLYAGRLLPKVLSCAVSVAARHADCVRDAWRHLLEIVHTLYAGRLLPKVLSCAVSVAARHADCVRDAWRHLLEIVHTLYAGRLLPKVLSCAVSVAARHADCVRDAWRHLLEIVHTLYAGRLLPKSLLEAEDYLSPSGTVSLIRDVNRGSEAGLLSSLYSYIALGETGMRAPTPHEKVLIDAATDCVDKCNLPGLLITETKFLQLESLQELIRGMVTVGAPPDAETLQANPQAEDVAVFFLELLGHTLIQNRDRALEVWPEASSHLTLVLQWACTRPAPTPTRVLTTLLRTCARLMRSELCCARALTHLHTLFTLPHAVFRRHCTVISCGLYELVKTSAQNVHSAEEWEIVFSLLCAAGPAPAARHAAPARPPRLQRWDRALEVWPEASSHLTLVLQWACTRPAPTPTRVLTTLLRTCARLMRSELCCARALTHLHTLFTLPHAVFRRHCTVISCGLYELVKTSAQNVHSAEEWEIVFSLLCAAGAGAWPRHAAPAPAPAPASNAASSRSEGSEEEGERRPTSASSDSELSQSPRAHGWILVKNEQTTSDSDLDTEQVTFLPYRRAALARCCEALALVVRDVAHVTPHNCRAAVRAVRLFARATLHAGAPLYVRHVAHVTPHNCRAAVRAVRLFARATLHAGAPLYVRHVAHVTPHNCRAAVRAVRLFARATLHAGQCRPCGRKARRSMCGTWRTSRRTTAAPPCAPCGCSRGPRSTQVSAARAAVRRAALCAARGARHAAQLPRRRARRAAVRAGHAPRRSVRPCGRKARRSMCGTWRTSRRTTAAPPCAPCGCSRGPRSTQVSAARAAVRRAALCAPLYVRHVAHVTPHNCRAAVRAVRLFARATLHAGAPLYVRHVAHVTPHNCRAAVRAVRLFARATLHAGAPLYVRHVAHVTPHNCRAAVRAVRLFARATLHAGAPLYVRHVAHVTPHNCRAAVRAVRLFARATLHAGAPLYVRHVAHVTPHNCRAAVRAVRLFARATLHAGAPLYVRHVAHVTPHNCRAAVRAVRAVRLFARATLHADKKPRAARPGRKQRPSSARRDSFEETSDEEDETLDQDHMVSLQLLDLMHTLHSRTAQIFKWWRDEADQDQGAEEYDLWEVAWKPLLQGIAEFCTDKRKQVANSAIAYLQRALLAPGLHALGGARWEACFARVLFPLLGRVAPPAASRANTILCKVFLHHLSALSPRASFGALWLRVVGVQRALISAPDDPLTEAALESLKNMILVMHSVRVTISVANNLQIFTNGEGYNDLWYITWEKIGEFLPTLKDELFPEVKAAVKPPASVLPPTLVPQPPTSPTILPAQPQYVPPMQNPYNTITQPCAPPTLAQTYSSSPTLAQTSSPVNVGAPTLVAQPTLVAPVPVSGMVPIRNQLYDQPGLTSSVLLQPLNEMVSTPIGISLQSQIPVLYRAPELAPAAEPAGPPPADPAPPPPADPAPNPKPTILDMDDSTDNLEQSELYAEYLTNPYNDTKLSPKEATLYDPEDLQNEMELRNPLLALDKKSISANATPMHTIKAQFGSTDNVRQEGVFNFTNYFGSNQLISPGSEVFDTLSGDG
ncbi:hypothetical protein MSG28_012998 [Choristoneura fumiferana]|uniref:Uncharacterized protein n=1 Tax=Choristoneura fumiferana TaxID=7141 RepID=A0ACC0KS52_CHOFU|nr:hypothetical protein MSG28_012998 [Choristoneura fumiferana]